MRNCIGFAISASIVALTERKSVVYPLIVAKEPFKCPLTGMVHWISSESLGEVDDVTYFKNKMLQDMGIPKDFVDLSQVTSAGGRYKEYERLRNNPCS